MISLRQAVRISYKSSAVCFAAAKTKADIARVQRHRAERRLFELPNGPARQRTNARKSLWGNYFVAQGAEQEFYTNESSDPNVLGVKPRLEALWVQLGNNISDLPDWNEFSRRDLKTVIAFRNFNGLQLSVVRDVERNFSGNSHEIPTTNFETQFEEMLDLFINDIWAAEGMRRWTRSQVNRTPETQANLDAWDAVNDGAGQFFRNARRCCVRLGNNFRQYERGGPDEDGYRNKYTYRDANRYRAVNGLFALDAGDLAPNYLQRVENKRVTYR